MEWYLRANADVISITIADHTTYWDLTFP
jgi:hypothetical protein